MSGNKNNIAAAKALWQEYGESLNRMMMSYEADRALREDLSQNVFLALLSSVERVMAADNPRAYVFRIAHNVATDHIARESRHQWHELDEAMEDEGLTPEQRIEVDQQRSILMDAVRALKLPLRQVVTLLLEDFSQDDIAGILQISSGNVRVRINRAKQVLQEAMHGGNQTQAENQIAAGKQ
jgi:RNA polymerase sigma-70 factor (ECF subfamily)